jgi:glycosyltransferase involved in cell wall biosynthesis
VPECAVIVPVYRNAENVPELIERLALLNARVPGGIEAVLVVDGCPDNSHALLAEALPRSGLTARLLRLSRNFGSFAAIREGLRVADAPYRAVMAADLQEPAELIEAMFARLRRNDVDIVLGTRSARADALFDRWASNAFWGLYRRFVRADVPPGGVDVFACNQAFCDSLLRLNEARTTLVGQVLWLGFRRDTVAYARQPRRLGRSAWTFRRKLDYLLDSVYSFSDLPIRIFTALGVLGLLGSALFGAVVLLAHATGAIAVPGYAATVVTILFFAGLNLLGLGIIGAYVWRTYENSKGRPLAVVMDEQRYPHEPTA